MEPEFEEVEDVRARKCRWWFGTLNNYTNAELDEICALYHEGNVSYLVLGAEVGEVDHTPHVHVLVRYLVPQRMSSLQKVCSGRIHWEVPVNCKLVKQYCEKDGDFVTFGVWTDERQRSDLKESVALVWKDGIDGLLKSERGRESYVRFHSGFEKLAVHRLSTVGTRDDLQVVWLFGATGTGKTMYVHETCPTVWTHAACPLKWWDGYDGQSNVLLDDLRVGDAPFAYLLRILDIYGVQVEVKGGFVHLCAHVIYVTCPFCPRRCADQGRFGSVVS
jgi:hypothetical protein